MNNLQHRIHKIFEILSKDNPDPKTELNYTTPFTLLAAVLLSAQATDKQVNIATKNLFEIVKTPADLLKLGLDELENHVKSIGLYKSKAKNLIATALILQEKYNSEIPSNLEDLMSLPGVGRKTAHVVLNELYQIPTIAVDTHIFRVANRTKIGIGKDPIETEKSLIQNIPDQFKLKAHHHMILHGRYICKARKPLCQECKIYEYCDYDTKNID